jgi:hypothetical protein
MAGNNYPKKISNFNPNGVSHGLNKRERFNSDPYDKRKTAENNSHFPYNYHPPQDIIIDPKLVNYPLKSNYYNYQLHF